MSLDPISAGIDLISTVVGRIWPDKTLAEQEAFKAAMLQDADMTRLLSGQMQVNQSEAASDNLFVSGWRPAVGWICVLAMGWEFVVLPILLFSSTYLGHVIVVPTFDSSTMMTILMGMLGLGGLRTYEKVQGVARIK